LEFDIIEEVIDDMLINKDHKESIYTFFEKVNMRTFDLLTNLIKEMNLFGEDAIDCGRHLNLKPEEKYYNVTEIFEGKEYEFKDGDVLKNESWIGSNFEGRIKEHTKVGSYDAIVPMITGRAWVMGEATWMLDENDPFPNGFIV
jgi:hypothetical protein